MADIVTVDALRFLSGLELISESMLYAVLCDCLMQTRSFKVNDKSHLYLVL